MNRYRVILALAATGQVRRPDDPTKFAHVGEGESWRTFEKEDEALQFKDDVLRRFNDLEVVVLDEAKEKPVRRFSCDAGAVVCEVYPRSDKTA